MRAIIFYLAAIGSIFSASFMAPVIVAFASGEFQIAYRLLIYLILAAFLSSAALLATWGSGKQLPRLGGLYLVGAGWLILPCLAAVPLIDLGNLNPLEGWYEAVSGMTTTGASVFDEQAKLPLSLLVYRSLLEWMGGLCTLLTFVLFLGPSGIGGLPNDRVMSYVGSFYTTPGRTMHVAAVILQIYVLVTLSCLIALMVIGTDPYAAFVLSVVAVSTGGFLGPGMLVDESIGPAGMIILSVFLVLGATSILWQRMLLLRRVGDLRSHRESYFVFAVVAVLAVVLTAKILQSGGSAQPFQDVSEGLFNAASLVSTSGVQTRSGIFALLPAGLVIAVLLVGGGAFSTAGGIKLFRIGGMFSQSRFELNRLIHPHAIPPGHFGSQHFDMQMMKAIWSFFAAYVVLALLGTFALAANSMEFEAAFLAAVAAISNAGPAYGPEWGPPTNAGWPRYSEMSGSVLSILGTLMLLGRLEIFAIVALIRWRGKPGA